MRTLQGFLVAIAVPFVATVHAEEANPMDAMAADFAVNICGALAGGDPSNFAERLKSFPRATLEKPALLPDSLPGGREVIAAVLHVEPSTPVHRVVFRPQTGNPIVVAFVRTDLKSCDTFLFGKSNASNLVAEKLRKADSGWSEINTPLANQLVWQRQDDNGPVITFTTSANGNALTILDTTTLVDALLPTIAQYDAFADVVVGNCVKSVLANDKPRPDAFLSLFDIDKQHADGSFLLVSKSDVPGGRLLLVPAAYGTACMLAMDESVFPFDYYRRALNQAFLKFPGARREGAPSLFWVFADSASKKTALMSEREKEGMLVVTIEREE